MPGGRSGSVAGGAKRGGIFGLIGNFGSYQIGLWESLVGCGKGGGSMYLIRKGEKPRPVCVACNKAGGEGERNSQGNAHICKGCMGKLNRGEGLYIDPARIPDQRKAV